MSQLYRLGDEDLPVVSEGDSIPLNEPHVSEQAPVADSFERTEDKYLVPRHLYDLFLDLIQERMTACYPIPGTVYTLIESRYYDSPQLLFYQQHFQSLPLRYKLRTRRYGPNGEWQGNVLHLELKAKQDKISKKERLRIGDQELQTLACGNVLCYTPMLREMNLDIKKKRLRKRIEKINGVLDEFAPRPICAVRYVRRAFEDDEVRVTLDCDLRARLVGELNPEAVAEICGGSTWEKMKKMGRKIVDDDHFLLEIKHRGTKPEWLEQLLQSYELKDTAFSKYCYSMTGFIMACAPDTESDQEGTT